MIWFTFPLLFIPCLSLLPLLNHMLTETQAKSELVDLLEEILASAEPREIDIFEEDPAVAHEMQAYIGHGSNR